MTKVDNPNKQKLPLHKFIATGGKPKAKKTTQGTMNPKTGK